MSETIIVTKMPALFLILRAKAKLMSEKAEESTSSKDTTESFEAYLEMTAYKMAAGLVFNPNYSEEERIRMFFKDDYELIESLYGESGDNEAKAINELIDKYGK